jgi:hypothetical protein
MSEKPSEPENTTEEPEVEGHLTAFATSESPEQRDVEAHLRAAGPVERSPAESEASEEQEGAEVEGHLRSLGPSEAKRPSPSEGAE